MQTRQVVLTTKVALVGFEDVKDTAIVGAIKSQVVATLASHGIHGLVSTSSVSERFALKSPAGVDDNSAWTNLVTDSEAGLKAHRCGYQAQAQTSGSKGGDAVSQHTAERQHIEAILSSAKAMSTPDEYVRPNFNCSSCNYTALWAASIPDASHTLSASFCAVLFPQTISLEMVLLFFFFLFFFSSLLPLSPTYTMRTVMVTAVCRQETVILLDAPCAGTHVDASKPPVLLFDDRRTAVLLNGTCVSCFRESRCDSA